MSSHIKYEDGFNSQKNKAILWDLMYQNGTFNALPQDTVEKVKEVFENMVKSNDVGGEDVTTKNKRVLMGMNEHIRMINTSRVLEPRMPITSGELSTQRRMEFDQNLTKRREEFDSLGQRPVPKEIDFSDKSDTPISGSMDRMLEDAIAKRERDFKQVANKQPPVATSAPATSAPARPATPAPAMIIQPQQANVELKIGETIADIGITSIPVVQSNSNSNNNNKRVSFDDENRGTNGMVPDSSKIEQVYRMIEKMNNQQEKIITLLESLNNK